jgi:hypothetical protein
MIPANAGQDNSQVSRQTMICKSLAEGPPGNRDVKRLEPQGGSPRVKSPAREWNEK